MEHTLYFTDKLYEPNYKQFHFIFSWNLFIFYFIIEEKIKINFPFYFLETKKFCIQNEICK